MRSSQHRHWLPCTRSIPLLAVLLATACGGSQGAPAAVDATLSDSGPADSASLDVAVDAGQQIADVANDVVLADVLPDVENDATSEPIPDAPSDVGPAADVPPPPPKGDSQWLSHDDDAAVGAIQYQKTPEATYEYVRFEMEQPVRIWALRAQLRVPGPTDVTLYLWDDFGGNFFNFDVDAPLATMTRAVSPADEGQWLTFELPYPVDLDPGRMFYAGLVVDGEGVQLMVDAGAVVPEGKQPTSLAWLSAEPPDEQGFPTLLGAPGDFMLRAEIELIHVVAEADRDFEKIPADELGIPGMSRPAFADVDGDMDLDIMTDGPRLYLNDGAGHFTDVTAQWLPEISGHNGGVFGDFDNDGDPDYFATGHKSPADRLLRNDGGIFTDVTAESGIDDNQDWNCNGEEGVQPVPTEAAAVLDYDNDGWLDIYQANFICWDPPAVGSMDLFWHNNGDGTFTNATQALGADDGQWKGLAGRGVAPADSDGDGWVDVLTTDYRLHKDLFFQNKSGQKMSMTSDANHLSGKGTMWGGAVYFGHSIGAAWGDIDQDGDLDVFVASLAHPRFITFSQKATMYLNPGGPEPVFEDVTEAMGIRYLETPSNPNLWDYDNDSDLDLFYTCIYEDRSSQLYRNDGHPAWTEVTYPSGLAVYNGWGSAVADIDGDGDLDLVASGQYFRNRNKSGGGAIFVIPVGSGAGMTNRDGVGVRVTATVDGREVLRERFGGHGTGVQDSPRIHVGLGAQPQVDLVVTFPASGVVVQVPKVPAGSRVRVFEDGEIEVVPASS